MFIRAFFVSLASAACLGTATAEIKANFCHEDSACKRINLRNLASVVVKSVTVTQHATDGVCQKDKSNIAKNIPGQQSYSIKVDPNCSYHIKFKTTSGCTGDKKGKITPSNMSNGKNTVSLEGACGSLNVRTYKRDIDVRDLEATN